MIRRLAVGLAAALAFSLLAPITTAAAADPVVTFTGGGWGHGVGASQYGMLGRAKAGHSHQQILAHYYDGSTIGSGVTNNDVDVLVGVQSQVVLSSPNAGSFRIDIDGVPKTWAAEPVQVRRDANGWHVFQGDGNAVGPVDLCAPGCPGGKLSVGISPTARATVEGISEYGHGAIELHPAGSCSEASGDALCVIVGGMTLEDYTKGVQEVPASWPGAALRAQAIAARSFAVASMRHGVFDLYSGVSDQVYGGWAREGSCGGWCGAVDATAGHVIQVGGQTVAGYYSSSNGGYSASNVDVWGSSQYSYLKAKPDPYDADPTNPNAAWDRTYTTAQLGQWLTAAGLGVGTLDTVSLSNVPPSGYTDKATVTIDGSAGTVTTTGYKLWSAISAGCTGNPTGCPDGRIPGRRFWISNFLDVPAGSYFAEPVAWMVDEEITSGFTPNEFGPGQPNTRAQLVTFLHRFADEPPAAVPTQFADVQRNAYYEEAVAWAADAGVTLGLTPTRFDPAGVITRAQVAAMLWRFAGSPQSSATIPFTDVPGGAYYAPAVQWMVEWDVTQGTTPTTYSPGEILNRAQIATFLWRLAAQPDAFAPGVTLPTGMRVS